MKQVAKLKNWSFSAAWHCEKQNGHLKQEIVNKWFLAIRCGEKETSFLFLSSISFDMTSWSYQCAIFFIPFRSFIFIPAFHLLVAGKSSRSRIRNTHRQYQSQLPQSHEAHAELDLLYQSVYKSPCFVIRQCHPRQELEEEPSVPPDLGACKTKS